MLANSDDPESMRRLEGFLGPGEVDRHVREAVQFAWLMLPKERRNVDEVERQIRRIVERVLKDLREDGEAFKRKPPD
jgi:hypothetical protein